MNRNHKSETPHGRWLALLCLLVPAHFTIAYLTMTSTMVPFTPEAGLGLWGGPFAARMLPTLLWKALAAVLHPFGSHSLPALNRPFQSNEAWFVAALTYLSLAGATFALRSVLRSMREGWLAWLALLLPAMAYFDLVLVLNRNLYYPYDLTALFLFTVLVCAAFLDRPILFAVVLAVAMLNKETAGMAVIAYGALQYGRKPLRWLIPYLAGMAAIVVAVRTGQKMWLAHVCKMCGWGTQVNYAYNLHQLANPIFWISLSSVFAFGWVAVAILWKWTPLRMRRAVLWVGIPWLAAMLRSGILREIRIFSELSPLIVLAIATALDARVQPRSSVLE